MCGSRAGLSGGAARVGGDKISAGARQPVTFVASYSEHIAGKAVTMRGRSFLGRSANRLH